MVPPCGTGAPRRPGPAAKPHDTQPAGFDEASRGRGRRGPLCSPPLVSPDGPWGGPRMPTISPILLGLGLLAAGDAPPRPADLDVAPLQELLHDRQSPRGQSQAALLLVQSGGAGAEAA